MLNKNFLLFSCFAILILLWSCSEHRQQRHSQFQEWMTNNGKLKVLSTTGMIDDLVKNIGGSHVDALTLIHGELDPHSYQLVKGDDEKLSFAQIIFYNGLELEHGPSLHNYLLHNDKAVSLGDRIIQTDPSQVILVDQKADPHIWMDVSLWARSVPIIVETLSRLDPPHADDYRRNGEKLMAEMADAHVEIKSTMHKVPEHQRYLVTSHDAFNYFTRAYLSEEGERESGEWRKRFAAPEGLAPESQLSTIHIKEIIDYLREHQIHQIFAESNVSRDSINKIIQAGQEQGLNIEVACCVLYSDAMGEKGSEADSYLKMILYNARTLSSHLGDHQSHIPKEK
jgi:manganese/zinc/iron transport system substrate-binding protein